MKKSKEKGMDDLGRDRNLDSVVLKSHRAFEKII